MARVGCESKIITFHDSTYTALIRNSESLRFDYQPVQDRFIMELFVIYLSIEYQRAANAKLSIASLS